jgi:FkbH-like protein
MKVAEAIAIANRSAPSDAVTRTASLLCGFTPLHLQTYVKAHLKLRFPDSGAQIETGLYGDLPGNLDRAQSGSTLAVVMEWSDIDPRLGWRHSGGWGTKAAAQVAADAALNFERILGTLSRMEGKNTVAICPPTLPVSIPGHAIPAQADMLRLELDALLANFLKSAAALDGVRVISRTEIDAHSPVSDRYDMRLDLTAGFPYKTAHANAIASALVEVLFPAPPKKALITDLDDTLWRGIVGEVGPENVSWDLARHTHAHALYQQALAALADYGVLVGCASKNDVAVVRKTFERPDILISEAQIFPLEVHWGAKSESVGRILKAWNIGADSVVFVDDSPIELAEVQAKFPEIECILFPTEDVEGVGKLLARLRKLFGKSAVLDEDRIRAASLRAAVEIPAETAAASTDFLERAEGAITFDAVKNPRDPRPLELINKTNQFNLNGRRITEADWRALLENPESFTLTISYQDRFGPLGKIAVVAGTVKNGTANIDVWVMSCRAFSRRIEHHTLNHIFSKLSAEHAVLSYAPTDRNGPLQEFLGSLAEIETAPVRIPRASFVDRCPPLPHSVLQVS